MAKKSKSRPGLLMGASKQPTEQIREEPESHAPGSPDESVSSLQAEPEMSMEALRQELSEVRELARSLYATTQEVKAQSSRNELMRNAMQDVKADVRAASMAMQAPAGYPVGAVDPRGVEMERCGPCECVSSDCCCFDIKVWQVRATSAQTELGDTGELTLPIPTSNPLEVQMYFTVDGLGLLWPGIGSTTDLPVEGGLSPGPGPWLEIDKTVAHVCFRKGTTLTKVFRAWCREHDAGIERPVAFKDEYGEGMGSITLDCCMETIYPPMPIDIQLNMGGRGGGSVQVAFYAKRTCGCC